MRNPFKRRKNHTIAELESYYASQGGARRSSTAWVMAIISLLITLIVIALLYFGVRWIYRTVTVDNTDSTVATGTINGQVDADSGSTTISGDDSSDPRSSEDVVVGVLNPTTDEDDGEGVVTDEAASTSRSVAGDSTNSSTITAAGGDELPDTGAGESLALLLVSVTIIGYFAARKTQLHK